MKMWGDVEQEISKAYSCKMALLLSELMRVVLIQRVDIYLPHKVYCDA
jgi:hypothetical protein